MIQFKQQTSLIDREITVAVIQSTCNFFNVDFETLKNCESARMANIRYLCFYLILTNTSLRDREVGEIFGKSRNAVWAGKYKISFEMGIYGQTVGNLRALINIANTFEKKFQWHLQ